jgi:hypothetical protein
MSGTPYICGDDADEIRDAVLIDRRSVADIADRLRVDTEYLGRLLQLPPVTHQHVHASDDVDIWAADRLDDVL